jgi:hypothetical protein
VVARRNAAIVTVEQIRHSGILCGPGRAIKPAIESVGSPSQYDVVRRGWKIPLRFLDDALVALELAGHTIQIMGPGW